MSIRKTESRLPLGLQAIDLGEAEPSADGKFSLISFFTSPLTPFLNNTYVVFVHDATLISTVNSFVWHIAEDGSEPLTVTTTVGEVNYLTRNSGNITISVQLRDNTNAVLGRVLMFQRIEQLNPTTEEEIRVATEKEGAGAANPAIVRELVNGHSAYYKNIQPQTPEGDDAFQRFVSGIVFRGLLKNTPEKRTEIFNRLADSIEQNPESFAVNAASGVGVTDLRLALTAMVYPAGSPLLPWTELPEQSDQNAFADEELRQQFKSISDENKRDLLNLARFPKTNIALCAKVIEALRNKYFSGAGFNDVMTGMNGTRGHWILKHYLKGPLKT